MYDFDIVIKEEYRLKTGRDHSLLITNVSPEHFYIYKEVVPKFSEIEILDKAFDVFGNILVEHKAIVFKEKVNLIILQDFWKECDKVRVISKNLK